MSKGRVAPSIPYRPFLLAELRDPANAADHLNGAAADDHPDIFLIALRDVVDAYGGIGVIAKRAKLNRQQLYKTLAWGGNPEFRTLSAILDAAGFALTVVPKERLKVRKSRPAAVRNRKSGARVAAKPIVARRRLPEPGVARQT
jgi:probable addiction module antidote protein